MKTIHHLTHKEIEDAIVDYMTAKLRERGTVSLKAEIIVELERFETGDPRDPPGTQVKAIRAEVTEEE